MEIDSASLLASPALVEYIQKTMTEREYEKVAANIKKVLAQYLESPVGFYTSDILLLELELAATYPTKVVISHCLMNGYLRLFADIAPEKPFIYTIHSLRLH